MGLKGQCSRCDWTIERRLKNMTRSCPKCGGAVYLHESEKSSAAVTIAISIAIMAILAITIEVLSNVK